MRRQTHSSVLPDDWAFQPLDIDPFHLPIRYNLPLSGAAGQYFSGRDEIVLGRRSVTVRRVICGATLSFKRFALSEFEGVAIRIAAYVGPEGKHQVAINLHHEDPALCLPLYMDYDLDIAGPRWQALGRMLRLPLMVPVPDGSWAKPFEPEEPALLAYAIPRNPKLALASRRPRIRYFREAGASSGLGVIEGAEIIARD